MQHDQHVIAFWKDREQMQQLWRTLSALATRKPERTMAFLPSELNDMLA